jgi:hypothetical protein
MHTTGAFRLALRTFRAGVAQMAERPPCKRQVSGSIPLTGSTRSPSGMKTSRLPGSSSSPPACGNAGREGSGMTQAPRTAPDA